MKVMRVTDSAQGPPLVEADAPDPRPGPGEELIRVHAAGVTTTELLWYPTTHTKTGEKRTGAVPSHEFSDVVADVGEDVDRLEIGREVYGMNDWFSDGALAEYCLAPFSSVAPKPASLTHAEAASVPIPALTAWQGLSIGPNSSLVKGSWYTAGQAPSDCSQYNLPGSTART